MQKQKYQAYAAAAQTVAKTKQIVMLYDGIIRFLQQAKEAIREKRIEDRYNMLVKATDVIMGLQSCLDFENGGDIAKTLYNYYSMVDSRIFSIHRTNSIETCDEVIAELKKMRDAWDHIDQSSSGNDTATVQSIPQQPTNVPPAPASDQNITLSA